MNKDQADPQLAELEQIANEIGTKGATGDSAMVELAKGVKDALGTMTSAFNGLSSLLKGKAKAKDDDDDDDTDDGEGDSDPGYQDMQMGSQARPVSAAVAPQAVGNDFDATAFIMNQAAQMADLKKAVTRLEGENAELRTLVSAGFAGLAEAIQASAMAQAQIAVPLAKAVQETKDALLSIPAGAITTPPRPRAPASTGPLGGSKRSQLQSLTKAVRIGILDHEEKALFEATGKFSTDPTREAVIRQQIQPVVAEFTTAA